MADEADERPQQQTNINVTINPPKGKPVSKVAYVLLALFLGGLGIHNFYGGHPFLGVLYILFCWTCIPSVIALIQAIVALCKHADADGKIYV